MFHDQKQSTPKAARVASEESTFYPLPALVKLIGLAPYKKWSCSLLLSPAHFIISANALHKSISKKMHCTKHQFKAHGIGESSWINMHC